MNTAILFMFSEFMLIGRLGKNFNLQLEVAKKNFDVGGKLYCRFV